MWLLKRQEAFGQRHGYCSLLRVHTVDKIVGCGNERFGAVGTPQDKSTLSVESS